MESLDTLFIDLSDKSASEQEALLAKYLATDASNAKANLAMGKCLAAQGREHKAIAYFQKSMLGALSDAERIDCCSKLGSSLRCAGYEDEANNVLSSAI